jgi:ABC-2 type transport system ATP-binding protein
LIDHHPHRIYIGCDQPRRLAACIMEFEDVLSVKFSNEEGGVEVETGRPEQFYGRIPEVAEEHGIAVNRIFSQDDNLQAVFDYLIR